MPLAPELVDAELASYLRIEERELEAGGLNQTRQGAWH
jgi:hypothetical protein